MGLGSGLNESRVANTPVIGITHLALTAVLVGLALSAPAPAALSISDDLALVSIAGTVFLDSAVISNTLAVVTKEWLTAVLISGASSSTREETLFLLTLIGSIFFIENLSIFLKLLPFCFVITVLTVSAVVNGGT